MDDQLSALPANRSGVALVVMSFGLLRSNWKGVLSSLHFWLVEIVAILGLVLQGIAIFSIGELVSKNAVPMVSGNCGYPDISNNFSFTS